MHPAAQLALLIGVDDPAAERVASALARAGFAVSRVLWGGEAAALSAELRLVVVGAETPGTALIGLRQRCRALTAREPDVVALVGDAAQAARALDAGAADAWPLDASVAELELRLLVVARARAERAALVGLLESGQGNVLVLDAVGGIRSITQRGLGAPGGSPLGRPGIEQIAPEHRGRVGDAFLAAARTGAPQSYEAASVFGMTYQCRLVPIEVAGRFDGAIIHATDVTERRWTEVEHRTMTGKAQAILRAIPDLMFWIRRDGELLDYYAGDESKLLIPPARIVGSRLQEVMPPPVAASLLEAIAKTLASGRIQRVEYQLPIGDRTLDFEARIMASGPDEVVAVVRDVTDRTHMQAQLAIADRLAALGTLAAGVAHEINNPLTYILIGVESVTKDLRRLPTDRPLGERTGVLVGRLEGALEGARRVRRIVADLKAFARGDDDDGGPVDVRAILDGVVTLVDSLVRYRGSVVKDYQDVPRVRAGSDRLNQVFLNLLINAAQALPEGRAAEHTIRLVVAPDPQGRVVVEVVDSGQGIAPEDLGRIFDPFFTTKPVGVGTGLGLWICHSIVNALGGEISVDSKVGVGTSVRVVLPAADATAPAPSASASASEDETLRLSGRILIIDDEARVASALGLLFDGCEVVTVASGRAALDALARTAAFDWIFCDVMMPDGSGMEVFEQIREQRPGLEERIIFMTGGAFTPRARDFLASVDNPVLQKPFRHKDLTELLHRRAGVLRARAG